MTNEMHKLIGTWHTDPDDIQSLDKYGLVTLEFSEDGHLRYMVAQPGKKQVILLTYSVHGDVLETDQPSHPHLEHTHFRFIDDNKLVLEYEQGRTYYLRQ